MKKRFLGIILSFAIVMCGTMVASAKPVFESKPEVLEINVDDTVYSETKIQQLTESKLDLDNGVVMFYGRDLDVNKINNIYLTDVNAPKLYDSIGNSKSTISSSEMNTQISEENLENQGLDRNHEDDNFVTETYAVLIKHYNGRYSISYESTTYPLEAKDDIELYFDNVLSPDSLSTLTKEFVENSNTTMAADSFIAVDVQDNNSFSNYYKPSGYNPPQQFLMLMYKKQITYLAYKMADAIADYDYYVINPIVNITPGNSLTQTYPQFKNAIVVIGAQTDIWRNYEADSMFQGKPDEATVNPLKPANYSYSISVGIPKSFSFGFSWTPTNKISRTSTFDAGYFNNFYGGQDSSKKWCISTSRFSYSMAASLRSWGSWFTFDVNTSVKTLFQNQGLDSAVWAGTRKNLSYQA